MPSKQIKIKQFKTKWGEFNKKLVVPNLSLFSYLEELGLISYII